MLRFLQIVSEGLWYIRIFSTLFCPRTGKKTNFVERKPCVRSENGQFARHGDLAPDVQVVQRLPAVYGQEGMMSGYLNNASCACANAETGFDTTVDPVADRRRTHFARFGNAADFRQFALYRRFDRHTLARSWVVDQAVVLEAFAHTGSCGDDDQIRRLQTRRHIVQVAEGGHASAECVLVLVPLFDAVELFVEQRAQMVEELPHTLLTDLMDEALGFVHDLVDHIEFCVRERLYL